MNINPKQFGCQMSKGKNAIWYCGLCSTKDTKDTQIQSSPDP